MKRQQIFLISGALFILLLFFFFAKTSNSKREAHQNNTQESNSNAIIQFSDLLAKAKQQLTSEQNQRLVSLENTVTRGDVNNQQIHVFHQLARFWKDSAHIFEPYAYYTAEAAKLDNSEKSLTFAAQLFIDNLLTESNPGMQNWLATQAKVLLDKALQINPSNDSAKIGIGACYMFGNISTNPMEGILAVREIAEKKPDNLYAQFILGLGGKKSGQYDKAIERFKIVINKEPKNLEAIFQIAECYDIKGDKLNAVKWYTEAKNMISNNQIKKDLEKRINELK